MTTDIDKLLDFIAFTHDIRSVKRAMWVKDEESYENNSEHSYQIAMTAMYIIESKKLSLDLYKCMALATIHDVIEVHAGDTHTFGNQKYIDTKTERELAARKQLKKQWPDFLLMHKLIDEYEARQTAESKFIYALDKLVPILNNYLDNGRNWKKDNVTFQDHVSNKARKVAVDSTINDYYNEIMKILESRPDLFPVI